MPRISQVVREGFADLVTKQYKEGRSTQAIWEHIRGLGFKGTKMSVWRYLYSLQRREMKDLGADHPIVQNIRDALNTYNENLNEIFERCKRTQDYDTALRAIEQIRKNYSLLLNTIERSMKPIIEIQNIQEYKLIVFLRELDYCPDCREMVHNAIKRLRDEDV